MAATWASSRRLTAALLLTLHLATSASSLSLSDRATSPSEASNPSVPLSGSLLEKLANHANAYASANGVQIERRTEEGSSAYQCVPMSLLPNAYPRSEFEKAKALAPPFNKLVDRISRDGDFLTSTLGGGVAETDPYTRKLLQLYKQIYMEETQNYAQSADRLGIHRSDYMLDSENNGEKYQIKQVELNTIASSFAALSTNVATLHQHLTSRFRSDIQDFLCLNKAVVSGSSELEADDGVPENPAIKCLPEAMSVVHTRYQARFGVETSIILFVVQEGETNTVDQRMLEFQLWDNYAIPVVRISLTKAHTELKLNGETGALTMGNREVSVVYFRAGYAPTDYPDGYDGIEWLAREKIERSRATKCPSLGYHLAGTKKVQQELARPGVLEKFFPEEESAVLGMRGAFAGLYSLGDDATDKDLETVKDVLEGAEGNYVLKPQREGGGYNFYGKQLLEKLQQNVDNSSDEIKLGRELSEFILMKRLFPPQQNAVLLRSGKVEGKGESISELGCFGTIVATHDGQIVHNQYSGFLLRTKFSNVNEGGVASGFASLSSPFLC